MLPKEILMIDFRCSEDRITGLKSSFRVTEKCAYCQDYSILPQDMAF